MQRRAKRMFSKADLKIAADIVAEARAERNHASLAMGSDVSARDASDAKVRKTLGRRLSRALPGFAEFQSIRKAHLGYHAKTGATFSGPANSSSHVRWGDLLATDDLSSEQFGPPFQVFDLHNDDPQHLLSNDYSFVSNSQGTMMNAFDFRHHYFGWPTADEWFGFERSTPAASGFVSCGINYTMPRVGRLRVTAVMQNFYSDVMYSIRDNFGLSYATLDIKVDLFVAFSRGGNTLYRPTTILSTSRRSDGGNVDGSVSGFDTTSPYSVTAESDEAAAVNDAVQVLAGCEVHIDSDVNDMTTRVNAVVRWQLRKLLVSVI